VTVPPIKILLFVGKSDDLRYHPIKVGYGVCTGMWSC